MEIVTSRDFNLIDYPGRVSSMVFCPGCNFSCPACHAALILKERKRMPEDNVLKSMGLQNRWIDGLVICGGEPTLQKDLLQFAEKIKKQGYSIKLDTNGSNPEILSEALEKRLFDYVAMDVKGPENLYLKICGTDVNMDDIKKSMILTSKFPDYEFRTTVVPVYKNEEPEFMNLEDIAKTAKIIKDITSSDSHKYFLQKFVPIKGNLLDPRLEQFPETPRKLMEDMLIEAKRYIPKTELRY